MWDESEVSVWVKGEACLADRFIKDSDWSISQGNIWVEVMIEVRFGEKSIELWSIFCLTFIVVLWKDKFSDDWSVTIDTLVFVWFLYFYSPIFQRSNILLYVLIWCLVDIGQLYVENCFIWMIFNVIGDIFPLDLTITIWKTVLYA